MNPILLLLLTATFAVADPSKGLLPFGDITIDGPLLTGDFELGFLVNGPFVSFEAILQFHLVRFLKRYLQDN